MYYYYKDGEYVGCGNEDVMQGCTVSTTPPVFPEPTEAIPTSITMRQARLQLLADNVLSTVSMAVGGMGQAAQIEWEYASEIERTNPLVPAMQAILSWDEARADQFYVDASKL